MPPASNASMTSGEGDNTATRIQRGDENRKVWQDWPGNQFFFKNGKVVVSKTWKGAVRTIALIIVLQVLYLVLVARRIERPWNLASIAAGSALGLLTILFLVQTWLTDPGMLPKLEPSEQYLRMQLPRNQYVPIGNRHITIRYDDTYHIYRPPRAHHCRVLNVVIARFDHFCPWTGTTIGLRNYRPFVLFLLTATINLVVAVGFCVLHIVLHVNDDGDREEGEVVAAAASEDGPPKRRESSLSKLVDIIPTPIVLVVLVAFLFAVGGLLGFHLYLIARGMTTYESIEGTGTMYSDGLFRNCWNVWLRPTEPPFVDFSLPVHTAATRPPPEIVRKYNPQCQGGDSLTPRSGPGAHPAMSPRRSTHSDTSFGDQNC